MAAAIATLARAATPRVGQGAFAAGPVAAAGATAAAPAGAPATRRIPSTG